jgi:hypothetical protein
VNGLPPWGKELGNDTCEVDPRGCHVALNQQTPKELQKDISAGSGLSFEHGESVWKTLDEQSVVETPNEGLDRLRRIKF